MAERGVSCRLEKYSPPFAFCGGVTFLKLLADVVTFFSDSTARQGEPHGHKQWRGHSHGGHMPDWEPSSAVTGCVVWRNSHHSSELHLPQLYHEVLTVPTSKGGLVPISKGSDSALAQGIDFGGSTKQRRF